VPVAGNPRWWRSPAAAAVMVVSWMLLPMNLASTSITPLGEGALAIAVGARFDVGAAERGAARNLNDHARLPTAAHSSLGIHVTCYRDPPTTSESVRSSGVERLAMCRRAPAMCRRGNRSTPHAIVGDCSVVSGKSVSSLPLLLIITPDSVRGHCDMDGAGGLGSFLYDVASIQPQI